MVEARNANYVTVSRHLCFGKRGAANSETEAGSAGSSRTEKGKHAAATIDSGTDSDDELPPEPKLLRVSVITCFLSFLMIKQSIKQTSGFRVNL